MPINLDQPTRRGKVRDLYDLGPAGLLMVASDRVSAFDHVLPTTIPDKGRLLTQLSAWWFGYLCASTGAVPTGMEPPGDGVAHHLITTDLDRMDLAGLTAPQRSWLDGRTMLVRPCRVVPFEFVIRNYLVGSGYKEYRRTGQVSGIPLEPGLSEGCPVPAIFTPTTKADRDEPATLRQIGQAIGDDMASRLAHLTGVLNERAVRLARSRGLVLVDTKFEFGIDPAGHPMLIDEVLTPDSSRYWVHPDGASAGVVSSAPGETSPLPGAAPASKQIIRDWLDASGWDRASPPPELPPDLVAHVRSAYIRVYETITGQPFPWA